MKKLSFVFASVLAIAGMASCNKDAQQPEEAVLNLSVEASTEATRGLSLDGKTLNAVWTSSDKVYVYAGDYAASHQVGTLTPANTGSANTNLTGTIKSGSVSVGTKLLFITPRSAWSYDSQDGTLASIASKYNYATATATVSAINGSDVTAGKAEFKNSQAIVRLKLQDSKGNAVKATQLEISASSGKLVKTRYISNGAFKSTPGTLLVEPEAATDELYVALMNESGAADTYTIDVLAGNNTYSATASANLLASHFYGVTVNLNEVSEVYTVAGSSGGGAGEPDDVFGTGWDPTNTANDMVKQSDGTYKKEYTLTKDADLAFKVVKDHAWGQEWPGSDYKISAAKGKVTIKFNPVKEEVTVDYTKASSDNVIYTVAGDNADLFGTAWDTTNTANDMVKQSDGTYLKTYTVTAGLAIQFKVVKNHGWTVNWGADNSNCEAGSNGNCLFNTTKDGTLSISFDPAKQYITATEN